ncbi:MAG: selenide, water dikinase SelD [Acidobacteria bacterium]|nr:selenide, water dikinase SelD [Acidobacteriota bacterium]
MPVVEDERMLIKESSMDDAGAYLMDDGTVMLQSADFFTPVVDDPYDFGWISAVNSFSDIYAMGGTPRTALNLMGWPSTGLDNSILVDILKGSAAAIRESGALPMGGHTIKSPELFFGLSVTGFVEKKNLKLNNTGKEGDILVLTKPLGTGALTTALKQGMVEENSLGVVIANMKHLNKNAAEAAVKANANAVTDVTGFGLLGHLHEMLIETELSAIINYDKVPFLDGAVNLIEKGAVPGGTKANRAHCSKFTIFGEKLSEAEKFSVCDPQTSGGLLIAVNEKNLPDLLKLLEGEPTAAVIGSLKKDNSNTITVSRD